jgi:hypothetical protein
MGAPATLRLVGWNDANTWTKEEGVIVNENPAKPVWRVEDGEPETVSIEYIFEGWEARRSARRVVEHASQRTLVLWGTGKNYENTVSGGKVFFVGRAGAPIIINGPQKMWGFHVNVEGRMYQPNILNNGGTMWILGLKAEKDRTIIHTKNGGRTELCGTLVYKNSHRLPDYPPAFIIEDSDASLCYVAIGKDYSIQVRETRGSETRELKVEDVPGKGNVPLYVGRGRPVAGADGP